MPLGTVSTEGLRGQVDSVVVLGFPKGGLESLLLVESLVRDRCDDYLS